MLNYATDLWACPRRPLSTRALVNICAQFGTQQQPTPSRILANKPIWMSKDTHPQLLDYFLFSLLVCNIILWARVFTWINQPRSINMLDHSIDQLVIFLRSVIKVGVCQVKSVPYNVQTKTSITKTKAVPASTVKFILARTIIYNSLRTVRYKA